MLSSFDTGTLLIMVLTMALAGGVTGILAGLFGIGGGAVLVPILVEFMNFQGVAPAVQAHIAVGTSLAIIVPTSIRSFRAHQKRGAPDEELLRNWLILTPLGVMVASVIVAFASGEALKIIFAVVAMLMAIKMLFNRASWSLGTDLPAQPTKGAVGFTIGFISTFMGIGGGNLNNVFMTSYGRPIHQAVATSAGLGVLIAVPGTLSYIINGWGNPQLPPFSLGYVNLLAFGMIMPISMLVAPLGVKFAHGLSKRQMELAFGVFLVVVSVRFFASVF
uniref:sulfite exporter TauE/SafE family protein n=1 Tax=Pararhizobium sp. IMCC3301 TaxID=3067904 RepID=UPI002740AB1B|nr:sulfite exporter TauE/SafE family protein [Pararhizobium sp. IMCC3301]